MNSRSAADATGAALDATGQGRSAALLRVGERRAERIAAGGIRRTEAGPVGGVTGIHGDHGETFMRVISMVRKLPRPTAGRSAGLRADPVAYP